MMVMIECPRCGLRADYDTDDDLLLCNECGEILIPEEEVFPSLQGEESSQ